MSCQFSNGQIRAGSDAQASGLVIAKPDYLFISRTGTDTYDAGYGPAGGGDPVVYASYTNPNAAGAIGMLSLATLGAGAHAFDNLQIIRTTTDPVSVITGITRNPGTGAVTIRFTSESGAIYAVEASTDLTEWTELDDSVTGQPRETEYTDSTEAPGKPEFFYRVRPQP